MNGNHLQKYREKIDAIDEKIIDLIAQRKEIVLKIGKWKKKNGWASPIDIKREEEKVRKIKEIASKKGIPQTVAERIMYILINFSRDLQSL